jgi:hypothetical protein
MKKEAISKKEAIKGYETKLSMNERADCVVCAFASSFNISYKKAHDFVKNRYDRQDKRGTFNFPWITTSMSDEVLFGKQINKHKPVDFKGNPCTTVGQFLTYYKYRKGTFLLRVRDHVFTVKNGVVIGNWDDSQKMRRILRGVWQITKA